MLSSIGPIFLLTLLVSDANATCRSPAQAHKFEVEQGYSHGRKGYVIDHICPLACGGIDDPKNMQYQTRADGKAKDKWERTPDGRKQLCNPENSTPTRQVFNCR
jgi:hypothetical protein